MAIEKTTDITETPEVKKKSGKLIIILILAVTIIVGAAIGIYFYRQSVNYLTTGNARINATLVPIVPLSTGRLSSFIAIEGRYVSEDEVLGRIEGGGVLRSPVDGVVVHVSAVSNQVVSPHAAVAVVADTSTVHIQVNIEETHIERLRVGQVVFVNIDAFGNQQFEGYISQIGRITDAALMGNLTSFTTAGTFTRVTQLIPVQITITDDVYLNDRIGLNATVRIPLR